MAHLGFMLTYMGQLHFQLVCGAYKRPICLTQKINILKEIIDKEESKNNITNKVSK